MNGKNISLVGDVGVSWFWNVREPTKKDVTEVPLICHDSFLYLRKSL
jgi:hypothetical protein